ncbi:MAG: hypothetical protein R3Y07_00900 [Eubacteriales bacterium]
MESQSYILGQFAATMHICEYTVLSEENAKMDVIIEEFMNDPVGSFVFCQTKIALMHKDLLYFRKNILIEEIKRIYQELDTYNLKNTRMDKRDFIAGYQIQLCWSKYVNV